MLATEVYVGKGSIKQAGVEDGGQVGHTDGKYTINLLGCPSTDAAAS